uniref:Uncharacterized protein n=1 Tax=Plectus sambesii TaxID=2011161 RepID=A0A914V944_9BILA
MKFSICLGLAISLIIFVAVDGQMDGGGLQAGGGGLLRQMIRARLMNGHGGLGHGGGGPLRQRLLQRMMGGSASNNSPVSSSSSAGGTDDLDLFSSMGMDGMF